MRFVFTLVVLAGTMTGALANDTTKQSAAAAVALYIVLANECAAFAIDSPMLTSTDEQALATLEAGGYDKAAATDLIQKMRTGPVKRMQPPATESFCRTMVHNIDTNLTAFREKLRSGS